MCVCMCLCILHTRFLYQYDTMFRMPITLTSHSFVTPKYQPLIYSYGSTRKSSTISTPKIRTTSHYLTTPPSTRFYRDDSLPAGPYTPTKNRPPKDYVSGITS